MTKGLPREPHEDGADGAKGGTRDIRATPGLIGVVVCAALLFVVVAVTSIQTRGWTVLSLGALALAAVGVLGVAESCFARIRLDGNAMSVRSLWYRRRYCADDVEKVTWENGAGVSVKLPSGRWVKLPALGRNSQGLANTMRAWARKHAPTP